MKIKIEETSDSRPFEQVGKIVRLLIDHGNQTIHPYLFALGKDGWYCSLKKPIDFDLLEANFEFPPTLEISREGDSILDTLTWVEIKGGEEEPSPFSGRRPPIEPGRCVNFRLLVHEKRKMTQTKKHSIKGILIAIIALPLIGMLYDAYSGFYVLRNSKTVYGIVAGLILTVILAFAGEYVSGVINAKDKITDPLYKRAFHLFILLASVGVIGFLYWFILHYFEILKI